MTRVFRRPRGGVLFLGPNVLRSMQALRQGHADSSEAGGILLGRMITDTDDVIIDEVTLPTESDRRGRFFFHRARTSGNKRIRQAWRESQGTRNYLGEWHTHPEDSPSPSSQDLRNWENIMRKSRIEQEYVLFLILGRKELVAWEWWKDSPGPHVLKVLRLPRATKRRSS